MTKRIEYENKQAIQNDESIPNKNKVTAGDMNEIKETINANADELENCKIEIVRLKNDLQSSQLTREVSGDSIDLNDSSNARFNKFEIYGNHKQETRTGKNHFFTSTSSSTTNGITYTPQADKSSIIVDGTATDNATKWLIVDAAQFKLEAGSYVLSSCGTCDNSIYIGLGGKTSSGAEKFNITEKGTAVSFNINEDVYLNCYIQTVSGTQIENKLIKIMIVKAGVDYQNYESYGAMPSPDFPSEIKTVGGNINLLNNTLQSQTINGLTVTVNDDKSVKIAGTATSNTNLVFDRHDGKLAAGTYTLKDCQTFIESTENHGWWAEGQTRTFTSEATLSNSGFYKYYSANTTVNETIYPMLVKGTMATSYVQYSQGSVEIKVVNNDNTQEQVITMPTQQEMLQGDYFDWENEKEVHNWEKLILTGDEYYTNPQTNLYNLGNLNKKSIPNLNLIVLQCNKYKAVKSVSTNNEFLNENADVDYVCGFHTNQTEIRIKDARFSSLTEFKNNIKQQYDAGTPVIIYYKLLKPTECDFTNKQKAVAKQIKETLHTYKNVTHIYSDDEISPIVNVEYAKDLNTTISNIQALVLNNASEEVSG